MLRPQRIPTPLIDHQQRAPVPIVAPAGLPRFRTIRIVASFLGVMLLLGWMRLRRKLTGEVAGRHVRQFLERQGFLWIKVGQLLSLREDLFSAEFCRELSRLQFQARGFPFALAKQTLEADLGPNLSHIFAELDEAPFAAASLSQVHRAVLKRTGALVVVKIQRPDVPSIFTRDMALIRGLVGFLQRLPSVPYFRWDDLLWELNQIMLEETDYRYEVSNLRRMRRSLRSHQVYVPRVFEELSTPRVLVMEFVQGVLMSDFIAMRQQAPGRLEAWLSENRIDPRKVGRRLFISFLRQLLEDNCFHGDLHPGNIVLLRDSRLALIDLGTVGTVEKEFLQHYMKSLRAGTSHRYEEAAEFGLLLCPDLPPLDFGKIKEELVQCYRDWDRQADLPDLPYHERSVTSMGNKTTEVLLRHGAVASMLFLKLGRTWGTLDASLAYLLPDADYPALMRSYFQEAKKRGRKRSPKQPGLLRSGMDVYESLAETSQMVGTILSRRALVFAGETTRFAHLIATAIQTARVVLLLVGLAWCLRLAAGIAEPWLPTSPVLDALQRMAAVVPAPLEVHWQGVCVAGWVVACVWLTRTQRRWLQSSIRLPAVLTFRP